MKYDTRVLLTPPGALPTCAARPPQGAPGLEKEER